MPHVVYAHKVNRVTFSGTSWGGAEEWSTGLWLGEENADAAAPTAAAATACLNAFAAAMQHGQAKISNSYSLTMCKIAAINTNGTTDTANVQYAYPAGSVTGNITDVKLPSQCSIVLTMLSDRPRGLASKGRMYLPGIAQMPTGDGKLDWQIVGAMATVWETFFNAIRASADVPNTPILAAKGTGAFPELTAQNDYIQTIRIGNVVDTQRRRRNGLSETYTSKTLV